MREHTIHISIHPAANTKPAVGAPCNGCGVCCLGEPCPLGMVVSRKRTGPCALLQWDSLHARYRCGAVAWADGATPASLWRRMQQWWVLRWIGAGAGCDCAWEVGMASSKESDSQQQKDIHGPR